MKQKIQQTMAIILGITLSLSVLLFGALVYYSNYNTMKAEVSREIQYITQGISVGGNAFIEKVMDNRTDSRITIIDKTGVVLQDTQTSPSIMDNHGTRKEVQEAFHKGEGYETRHSKTLGTQTFYHAVLLEDGRVIRVSRTINSVFTTMLELLPSFTMIGVLLLLLALYLSHRATQKLIQPINNLDIENPLENQVYSELAPLLQKLHDYNTSQEEIENIRKEFSANVSHELKTPLTSISGYAELMKNNMVRQDDVPRFAEKIHTEACRLVGLIEDIIRISQLDEQGIEMEKQNLDLYTMTREICSSLSYTAQTKSVNLSLTGHKVEIEGVQSILEEMLYNIIENAMKYNKENGTVDVWVGDTLEGPKVIVRDTGIGVPQEEKERIFERFYRVDKSHSKETGGTGLGLSIVKHGARLHNAQITVESELGIGTKISVLFPNKK